MNSLVM